MRTARLLLLASPTALSLALLLTGCGESSSSETQVIEPDGGGGNAGGGGSAVGGNGGNASGGSVNGGTGGTGGAVTGGTGGGGPGGTGGAVVGGEGGTGGVGGTGGSGGLEPDAGLAPDQGVEPGRHHPAGFGQPATHGLALNTAAEDCRSCHGDALEGGSAPSCDNCHAADWRTNCTFCHGGTDNPSGAPPRDIRGATVANELTFRAHTAHVTAQNHTAWDCTQCHTKPLDVLTDGHVFDATPGVAEVDFSAGLSPQGRYDGNGACANLYCHGTGRANAAVLHSSGTPDCNGCHTSAGLSNGHRRHTRFADCDQCHAETARGDSAIGNAANHVNGQRDVVFAMGNFTYEGGNCTGSCHGENHRSERW